MAREPVLTPTIAFAIVSAAEATIELSATCSLRLCMRCSCSAFGSSLRGAKLPLAMTFILPAETRTPHCARPCAVRTSLRLRALGSHLQLELGAQEWSCRRH